MLKIEVIKFEAQDVITASVAAPCAHTNIFEMTFDFGNTSYTDSECLDCGTKFDRVYH